MQLQNFSTFFLKSRTRVLPPPLRKWTNIIYQYSCNQFYTAMVFISTWLPPQSPAAWPRTLAPAAPHNIPRWLPTATYTISSTIQKYHFLTNHNKSSFTEALIRNIQPPINNQCTGINRGLKLFTHLPTIPCPSYSYNYLRFPSVTTYPTNCPHHFSFLSCTVPK